jgi:hypothetical protein
MRVLSLHAEPRCSEQDRVGAARDARLFKAVLRDAEKFHPLGAGQLACVSAIIREKRGFAVSYDQLMASNISAVPRAREVRSSCRLPSMVYSGSAVDLNSGDPSLLQRVSRTKTEISLITCRNLSISEIVGFF